MRRRWASSVVGDDGQGGVAGRDRRVVVVVVEEEKAPVRLVAGEDGLAGRFEADRLVEVAEGAGTLLGGRSLAGQLDVGPAAVEGGHVRAHGEGAAELGDGLVGLAPALVDLGEVRERQVVEAVQLGRRLQVGDRAVPLAAFEAEQAAVDQEDVAEVGVRRPGLVEEAFGLAVIEPRRRRTGGWRGRWETTAAWYEAKPRRTWSQAKPGSRWRQLPRWTSARSARISSGWRQQTAERAWAQKWSGWSRRAASK